MQVGHQAEPGCGCGPGAEDGAGADEPKGPGSEGLPGSPAELGLRFNRRPGPRKFPAPAESLSRPRAVRQESDVFRLAAHDKNQWKHQENIEEREILKSRTPALVDRYQRYNLNGNGRAYWAVGGHDPKGDVPPAAKEIHHRGLGHHSDQRWVADGPPQHVGDIELPDLSGFSEREIRQCSHYQAKRH